MSEIYESQSRIEKLKKRAGRCVCKFCGGSLCIRQIVFNDIDEARVEIFCEHCDVIEYGVEPELYHCAVGFIENTEFNCYEGMDDNEKTKSMNIAKVCEILTWSYKNMGFLSADGFAIPEKITLNRWPECLICSEDEIDSAKSFEAYLEELACQ
ncbi:MAG: hypothetical protein J6A10_03115 [Peptococcaceae bacterium]|nr:hypothetical protein [Peptococcaceae bacterium]MBO5428938.1 hypothetical protein [Peptococcaceae bacterium]